MPKVEIGLNDNFLGTDISNNFPTTSFVGRSYMSLQSGSEVRRLLFNNNFGKVPNDAIINKATLRLMQHSGNQSLYKITTHRLTQGIPHQVSWNTAPQFDPTPLTTFDSVNGDHVYINVDVTSLVQDFVNSKYPNYGFLLKNVAEGIDNNRNFYTLNNPGSQTHFKPVITVDYSIPTTNKKQVEVVYSESVTQGVDGLLNHITRLPDNVMVGDLVIIYSKINLGGYSITPKNGWQILDRLEVNSGRTYVMFYKRMEGNDLPLEYTTGANASTSNFAVVYRNVKSIKTFSTNMNYGVGTFYPGTDINTDTEFNMFASVILADTNAYTFEPPTSSQNVRRNYVDGLSFNVAIRYMYQTKYLADGNLGSTTGTNTQGAYFSLTLEPISNNPPTVTLTSPGNNQTVSTVAGRRTITLSGTITDPDNNTVTINAAINGKQKSIAVNNTSTAKAWSLSWDVVSDAIAEGKYSNIVVTADDGNGSTSSATYTGTITVDKTNPVITMSGVANGVTYQNSVTPTFSATDAGGSVLSSVTATLNGVAYTSGTAITTSGSKTLIVKAIDNAGNESQQTVNFSINKAPTISLTSPVDNQSLTEGSPYKVEGSAADPDVGNVVTAKYKINNGRIRALQSGVSNGSTPISFLLNLTYKNKRLWDGESDVYGSDLAENVDHTLTVWAEDDQGGRSGEVTRKFRVVWNRPPVIDGENKDLGSFMQPPVVNYSATDPEGNNFTFSEYLNGKQIRSFAGVAGQKYTVEISHDAWIRLDLDVQHQIKIVATDSAEISSERIYTFTRKETHIEFMLEYGNPDIKADFTLDGMPLRVLVTLERYLPEGSSIESVKVCNNYLDDVPTWEDCTGAVKGNRGYLFTNKNKTAPEWAINLWVTIDKGTARERVLVNGYGGAFD